MKANTKNNVVLSSVQLAKRLAMPFSKRHVNIRGYVKEVEVSHKNKDGDYVVKINNKTEVVPPHLFYHETPSGLILRDDPEFKRRYAEHPIEIIKINNVYSL